MRARAIVVTHNTSYKSAWARLRTAIKGSFSSKKADSGPEGVGEGVQAAEREKESLCHYTDSGFFVPWGECTARLYSLDGEPLESRILPYF
jgi:hypothetical protein